MPIVHHSKVDYLALIQSTSHCEIAFPLAKRVRWPAIPLPFQRFCAPPGKVIAAVEMELYHHGTWSGKIDIWWKFQVNLVWKYGCISLGEEKCRHGFVDVVSIIHRQGLPACQENPNPESPAGDGAARGGPSAILCRKYVIRNVSNSYKKYKAFFAMLFKTISGWVIVLH